MFRALYHCASPAQARTVRRLVSRHFAIPIGALLVQYDLSGGGKTPCVFFDAEQSSLLTARGRGAPIPAHLEDWEEQEQRDALQHKIEPFFRGYFTRR
jgi:hypothetical protein